VTGASPIQQEFKMNTTQTGTISVPSGIDPFGYAPPCGDATVTSAGSGTGDPQSTNPGGGANSDNPATMGTGPWPAANLGMMTPSNGAAEMNGPTPDGSATPPVPANVTFDPGACPASPATPPGGQAPPNQPMINAMTTPPADPVPTSAPSMTAPDGSGQPAPTPNPGIAMCDPTPGQLPAGADPAAPMIPPAAFTEALGLTMNFAPYAAGNVPDSSVCDPSAGAVPFDLPGAPFNPGVLGAIAQHMMALDVFSMTFAAEAAMVTAGAMPGPSGFPPAGVPPSVLMSMHSGPAGT
jgi:hypothetical protein